MLIASEIHRSIASPVAAALQRLAALARRWPRKSHLVELLFMSHTERLIGITRVVFAGFAFTAIWADPTQPVRFVDETYAILTAYLVYAVAVAFAAHRLARRRSLMLLVHGVDIVIVSVLVGFTGGPNSPFFTFFTFALLTATLRWSWRGAFATAVLLLLQMIVSSRPDLSFSYNQQSELNRVILRAGFLAVAAAMLGYLGAYRDRTRFRLRKLAAWPLDTSQTEITPPLAESLRHAAGVLGARHLVVFWCAEGDATGRLAVWSEGRCTFHDAVEAAPVAAGAGATRFLSLNDDRGGRVAAVYIAALRACLRAAPELKPPRHVCTASFQGSAFVGRLFVLDPAYHNEDVIALTEIAASHFSYQLERFALVGEFAAALIARDRVRLARDLHDSALQDLTAASLRLRMITDRAPPELTEELQALSGMILQQQQRIRSFVEETRGTPPGTQARLAPALTGLAASLERQWNSSVVLAITPPDLSVPASIASAILQLTSEAVANAVRHGRASRVDVVIDEGPDALRLRFRDDGDGLRQQPEVPPAPRSLKERVDDLGGTLSVAAADRGLEVQIELRR